MARVPDRDEHRRRFGALDVSDRRSIIRAVNKGRAVEQRKHAPLAVGVARQQQRFWRLAWIVGPVIGLVQLRAGWQAAVVNGALGTLFLAAICWFWIRRAQRAEAANLERMGKGGTSRSNGGKGGASTNKGGASGKGRKKDG